MKKEDVFIGQRVRVDGKEAIITHFTFEGSYADADGKFKRWAEPIHVVFPHHTQYPYNNAFGRYNHEDLELYNAIEEGKVPPLKPSGKTVKVEIDGVSYEAVIK